MEAVYTDKGAAGTVPLTGRAEAILHPKRKQAEFFSTTGRAANGTGSGDPGVLTEDTTDAGAGRNIGFIEDGDYVSFNPVSLKDIRQLNFRVASGGAGGNIEVRLDSPTGQLVGTAAVANTGGWQTWTNVVAAARQPADRHAPAVPRVPQRRPTPAACSTSTGSRPSARAPRSPRRRRSRPTPSPIPARRRSRCTSPAPRPTSTPSRATRSPTCGTSASPARTTTPRPSRTRPTRTQRAGTYNATFTATDADGGHASATVQVVVTAGGECPQNNLRSDEFDGDALDIEPLDHDPAGRHASADGVGREPELPDRQRLAVRGRHVGAEHRRTGPARPVPGR